MMSLPKLQPMPARLSALNTAQNSIKLALIVSIVTATLVIIFAVFITVRERTMEIGTLKAIGASHWQVIRQFWGEVLALSVVAALIAVVLLVTLGLGDYSGIQCFYTNHGGNDHGGKEWLRRWRLRRGSRSVRIPCHQSQCSPVFRYIERAGSTHHCWSGYGAGCVDKRHPSLVCGTYQTG